MYQQLLSLLLSSVIITPCVSQNVGIGTTQPTNRLHVTSAVTTSNGASIYAVNTGISGNAIYGTSNAAGTYGVQGLSTVGTGVYGYTNDFRAVAGAALGGTALYGNSSFGYGLEIVGKVKISGGNTSPSNGAVLTSDAAGNAVWKQGQVAFKVSGVGGTNIVADEQRRKVEFESQAFDYGDVYTPYAGAATTASSTFKAPVDGVYHFDVRLRLRTGTLEGFEDTEMTIRRNRAGSITTIGTVLGTSAFQQSATIDTVDDAIYNISTNEKLLAGDIIWVEIFQSSGSTANLTTGEQALFSGFLVFAE